MEKKKEQKSTEMTGRTFEKEDNERKDELSSGLAETREQVSDTYTEGNIDQEEKNKQKG